MNVDDLRSALIERAGTVSDNDASGRIAQVHARVRVARRRRVAGVATLTAGVLALVGAVSVLPDRGTEPDDTAPAATPDPGPAPTIEHENFVSHSGAFNLIAAKVGEPGQNTLDLTVPAHDGEVRVSMVCYGANFLDDDYWVSGWVGDTRPERPVSSWCGEDPDTPHIPGVANSPGPWIYPPAPIIQPEDDQRTVHVELTLEVDENGEPLGNFNDVGTYVRADNPAVTLGVAVYAVADPVATVASWEIPPLVGLDGQDYAYVEHRATRPGERTLTWKLPPSPKERYYDVVFTNAKTPGTPGSAVQAGLDEVHCGTGYASPRARMGGCLMSPDEPHTITVSIERDPPRNAVLGIVLYERTG